MRASWLKVIVLIGILLLAPIAWYLISPLFITRTVDEDFPVVAAAPAQEMVATTMPVATMMPQATPTSPPATQVAATSAARIPATPETTPTVTPLSSPTDRPEPTIIPSQTPAPTSEPTAVPVPMATTASEPVVVLSGAFHAVTHEGVGNATVYRLDDGQLVLRFEQFEVLNGPDLYVWLSGAADANSAQEIVDGGYLEVGLLKGNKGNQNYALPADIDISQYRSVTIWCKRFRVNFATAPLR